PKELPRGVAEDERTATLPPGRGGPGRSAPRIRTWTARLQRPACCRYTRADHARARPGRRPQSASRSGHDGQVATESSRPARARMTASQRRAQLLDVSRRLFAEKGFDLTSVEEIAVRAAVSKPVVYEHFGGKEGVYAVVVDREITALTDALTGALTEGGHPKVLVERTALALLTYIEENTDGFRILVRDSPVAQATGTFSSLIGDVATQVEHLLADQFKKQGLAPRTAPIYSRMLVGMVALTGQHWLEERSPKKADVAAHLVNLAWNGLKGLERRPTLTAPAPPARAA